MQSILAGFFSGTHCFSFVHENKTYSVYQIVPLRLANNNNNSKTKCGGIILMLRDQTVHNKKYTFLKIFWYSSPKKHFSLWQAQYFFLLSIIHLVYYFFI